MLPPPYTRRPGTRERSIDPRDTSAIRAAGQRNDERLIEVQVEDDAATVITLRPLYYRIYSENGAVPSKHAIYPRDANLGRTYAHWVTPPHTASSIIRLIASEEMLPAHIAARARLFENIASTVPMEGDAHLDILGDEGLGSLPENPLALVFSDPPPVPSAEPHASPHVLRGRRPGRATVQVVAKPPGWIRVQSNYKRTVEIDGWLTYEKGDILYASNEEEVDDSGRKCRMATNMTGSRRGKIYMFRFSVLPELEP